jgi:hypothetical protein
MLAGQQLGLLPSTEVVTGNRLYAYDVRFLKRHKIIPIRSKVLYFYSTASLDMHDAGNGFTEKTVFSYWHDDDGKLVIRSIPFSKVEKIAENVEGGFWDDKTLNIIDNSKDEFNLYLGSSDQKNKLFIKKILSQWRSELSAAKP